MHRFDHFSLKAMTGAFLVFVAASIAPAAIPAVGSDATDNHYLITSSLPANANTIYTENFARTHAGAQINILSSPLPLPAPYKPTDNIPTNEPWVLLTDDPTLGYDIPQGKTTLLITLPTSASINQLTFFQTGALGKVTISASPILVPSSSPRWKNVSTTDTLKAGENSIIRPQISPAAYYKLDFNLTAGGTLYDFGLQGSRPAVNLASNGNNSIATPDKLSRFIPAKSEIINYNYANLYAKGRVTQVSSAQNPNETANMIDDNANTSFVFLPEDKEPMALVDLGDCQTVRRISVLLQAPPGKMDFYLMNQVPGTQVSGAQAQAMALDQHRDWHLVPLLASTQDFPVGLVSQTSPGLDTAAKVKSGALSIPASFFEKNTPLKTVETQSDQNFCPLDFTPQGARYLLILFHPTTPGGSPLRITEIAVFGNAPLNRRDPVGEPIAGIDPVVLPISVGPPDILDPPQSIVPPTVPIVSP